MYRSGVVNSRKEVPIDIHGEQRSGRPSSISNDFPHKTEESIRTDRRLTIRGLYELIPEVFKTMIHEIWTKFEQS